MQLTHKKIFEIWKDVCSKYNAKLCDTWNDRKEYTNAILAGENSVLAEFAQELKLLFYLEYYNLDAVFYKEEDTVPSKALHETWTDVHGFWLRNIRIAFEHENAIWGANGAYQEMSHLLTTKAEYKMLVGYAIPGTEDACVQDFQSLIKDASDSVLLILGDKQDTQVLWKGYELTSTAIIPLS